ncbi:MAG: ATP-binding protein [Phycisphaerae bacterium]|jgi:signal transduction histidine kinase|nr:ATP-binding protein [Phycisphaerae bacterium]
MRIGIRTKLLVLLVSVALLPLIAALVTIAVGSGQLRTELYGQAISSTASVQAMALGVSLSKDIEKYYNEIQYEPEIVKMLSARDKPVDLKEIEAIEATWGAQTTESSETLRDILSNSIWRHLRRIKKDDPLIAEILVTDRAGRLVAATQKTSDYFQADEDWWEGAWCKGEGCIFTPPVDFDQSAGIWSIDVCIPIRADKEVVGIAKVVLDISAWVHMHTGRETAMIGTPPVAGSIMLVRRSGEIFHNDDRSRNGSSSPKPLSTVARQWNGEIAEGLNTGWRFTDNGMLQGFAPIVMPDRIGPHKVTMPSWSLVVYVPASGVLKPVHDLGFHVLWIGLLIIGAIFLLGIFVAEREFVRRIRWLGAAAKSVSEDNLSHRIRDDSGLWRLPGRDEIDTLTDDFNAMIARVERTHQMLREANELKTNFIRVAGHELRTPVAYILAMTRMLKDSHDPERLQKAVVTMGAKAHRLADIIDSIFKLLPGQGQQIHLRYEDVIFSELLEEVYMDCSPFMERRGQKFIIDSGENIPRLRVDRAKLRDVLENLVINSIKFTPDGGTIRLRAGMQLGGYISIAIEDQGPGIAAEDLPHVFDPFYSTKDVMKHSSGDAGGYQKRGMGLGLAIVRHFIEMHGGTVHVTTSGEGSVFTVTVPVEPPPGDNVE